jgi:hypothetical protein
MTTMNQGMLKEMPGELREKEREQKSEERD